MEATLKKLKDKFGSSILRESWFRDELTVWVRNSDLFAVCLYLKNLGFNFLVDICAIDNYPSEPRFEIVYHICNMDERKRIRVKTNASGKNPEVASVVPIWKTANWHERECYDLMGIKFVGHPDMRRILMPDDWQGYPLRKDYPLKG